MSHFTVLVIGENYEKQLAPFQENNMEDCPKEYLVFHNVNDEMVKSYKENTIPKVVMPNGALVYKYDDKFYTGSGLNRKHEIPKGLEIREIPISQEYPDFQKFVTEYHGYKRDPYNGLYGYYENPNQKWDWYQMGGRWTGFFKLKPINLLQSNEIIFNHLGLTLNEISNLANLYKENETKFNEVVMKYKGKESEVKTAVIQYLSQIFPNHKKGTPGLMTEQAKEGYADQAYKRDIDFEGMRTESEEKAAIKYDKVLSLIGPKLNTYISWNILHDKFPSNIDIARNAYHNQPVIQLLRNCEDKNMIWVEVDNFLCTREEYIQRARNSAISTFAILKDKKWYERGEMGWWACVSNEKDENNWNKEFNDLLDSLPDDTLLTVVDCHI